MSSSHTLSKSVIFYQLIEVYWININCQFHSTWKFEFWDSFN